MKNLKTVTKNLNNSRLKTDQKKAIKGGRKGNNNANDHNGDGTSVPPPIED